MGLGRVFTAFTAVMGVTSGGSEQVRFGLGHGFKDDLGFGQGGKSKTIKLYTHPSNLTNEECDTL